MIEYSIFHVIYTAEQKIDESRFDHHPGPRYMSSDADSYQGHSANRRPHASARHPYPWQAYWQPRKAVAEKLPGPATEPGQSHHVCDRILSK